MKLLWICAVLAAAGLAILGIQCARSTRLPISPALAEAIAKAQSSLPDFKARIREPRSRDAAFFARAELAGPQGHVEFIWLRRVQPTPTGIRGVVAEAPFALPNLHIGDSVEVADSKIVDWTVKEKDGSTDGNFTGGLEPQAH